MGGEILDVIHWTRAISLYYRDIPKVRVCDHFEDVDIRSGAGAVKLPSVVELCRYVYLSFESRVAINKRNLMHRDEGICQYCGHPVTHHSASIDHMMPTSRGGRHEWKNAVLACKPCNTRKGDKTPKEAGLQLRRVPFTPRREMFFVRFLQKPEYQCWMPYFEALGAI
jgi:5-methylcytosine-specific restriction endonuclease McrA